MTVLNQNKKYTIEYRIFKDVNFFKGWFSNMKPEWSPWHIWNSYSNLDEMTKEYNKLEAKKPYLKCRTEYKVRKIDD